MTLGERLKALDRLQHTRGFKLAASALVVLGALVALIAYVVIVTAPESKLSEIDRAVEQTRAQAEQIEATEAEQRGVTAYAETADAIRAILQTRERPLSAAIGIGAVAAVMLTVIWLGLALTYLALLLLVGAVAAPLWLYEPTRGYAVLIVGAAALTASFTAFMQGARMLLSGTHPVTAIARNVLAEAVRLKLSLVFIVLLVFMLAALPGLLDRDEELRYRVMTFLQYGTSGSFWIIALLTLFFSCATVTFEQRDKVIWQTITKPVAPSQYILGKWLGVVTLNAVLLLVCGAGVFLFTEYLRGTPAVGEKQAYVVESGPITKDRFLLETQVLTARRSVDAEHFYEGYDDPRFQESFNQFVATQRRTDPGFAPTEQAIAKVRNDLYRSVQEMYMALESGAADVYRFEGLGAAKRAGKPMTLQYRVDAGSNRPDAIYKITFAFPTLPPELGGITVREVAPGFLNAMPLSPAAIGDDGVLEVQIANYDALSGLANPETVSFPEGTLRVSYAAGGFGANFFRVVFVLWIKLAFLAMIAVLASTFLSFPVACLVAVAVFLMAETAGYLGMALDAYGTTNAEREIVWYKVIANVIGYPIHLAFAFYADLKPTARLVNGRLLAWGTVFTGTLLLMVLTLGMYGAAVLIFRKRELAVYSGH